MSNPPYYSNSAYYSGLESKLSTINDYFKIPTFFIDEY